MSARGLRIVRPFLRQSLRPSALQASRPQSRTASSTTHDVGDEPAPAEAKIRAGADPNVVDPGMNGGYVNPPPMKRALRDPYGDWWDKQERRNFGEPMHEDNDILARFSTEPYTHASAGTVWASMGVFVAAFLGLCGVVYQYYPDIPAVPRTFPDGLDVELGGPGAVLARKHGEDEP